MAIGQLGELFRREAGEDEARDFAQQLVTQAVQALEMLEQQDELFNVRERKTIVGAVEWVRHRMRQVLRREIFLQVENIFPQRLDLAMLRFALAPHEQVYLAAILGKTRGDL